MGIPDENDFEYAMTLVNIVAFLLLTMYAIVYVSIPPSKVQMQPLPQRVKFCIFWNIYVCAISMVMNLVSMSTKLDDGVMEWFGRYLHICRPLEWLLTCPLMMLQVVVVAGPLVPGRRRIEIVGTTVSVLIIGFFATVTERLEVRGCLFACGVCGFITLVHKFSQIMHEHTGGETSLFSMKPDKDGKHPALKKVLFKVLLTWVAFPIWWFLSPDGFNVMKDHDLHQGVFLLLNIISKAVFCYAIFCLDGVEEPVYVERYSETIQSPTFKHNYGTEKKPEPMSPIAAQEQLMQERMAKLDEMFEKLRQDRVSDKKKANNDAPKSKCLSQMVEETRRKINAIKDDVGDGANPTLAALWQFITKDGGGSASLQPVIKRNQ